MPQTLTFLYPCSTGDAHGTSPTGSHSAWSSLYLPDLWAVQNGGTYTWRAQHKICNTKGVTSFKPQEQDPLREEGLEKCAERHPVGIPTACVEELLEPFLPSRLVFFHYTICGLELVL
jgi:hypothetical protein